jgi:hypothetical protein
MKNHILKISFAMVIFLFTIEPAWAYLDPGSVSLWLQGILAGIAAIATTSRFWWFRLKDLVKKIFKRKGDK